MERGIQYPWTEYSCVEVFNYADAICLPQLSSVIAMMSISFYSDLFKKILVLLLFSWKVEIQHGIIWNFQLLLNFSESYSGLGEEGEICSESVLLLPMNGFFSLSSKLQIRKSCYFAYFLNFHERTLASIMSASRPHKKCESVPAPMVK